MAAVDSMVAAVADSTEAEVGAVAAAIAADLEAIGAGERTRIAAGTGDIVGLLPTAEEHRTDSRAAVQRTGLAETSGGREVLRRA